MWKEIINMKNIQHEEKRRMVMYTEDLGLGREQEINTKEERKRRRKGGEGKRCS